MCVLTRVCVRLNFLYLLIFPNLLSIYFRGWIPPFVVAIKAYECKIMWTTRSSYVVWFLSVIVKPLKRYLIFRLYPGVRINKMVIGLGRIWVQMKSIVLSSSNLWADKLHLLLVHLCRVITWTFCRFTSNIKSAVSHFSVLFLCFGYLWIKGKLGVWMKNGKFPREHQLNMFEWVFVRDLFLNVPSSSFFFVGKPSFALSNLYPLTVFLIFT